MNGPHNRPRRWAVTRIASGSEWLPTVSATYWTRWAANRAAHRANILTTGQHTVRPSDYAPYRHRRAEIVATLQHGPRSVDGITARTALTWDTVADTLLRMAREGIVAHRVFDIETAGTSAPMPGLADLVDLPMPVVIRPRQADDHDKPGRGVWRYVPATERHTTP